MLGIWEHRITGEIFEIFERKDRKTGTKGGYEINLYLKYLFSITKNDSVPFIVKKDHLEKQKNFDLIIKVQELPIFKEERTCTL